MIGTATAFDKNALVKRYLQISCGDNGLSDEDVFPEWLRGIVGPDGPHKILDWATVDPADQASVDLTAYECVGLIYTCSLLNTWMNNVKPDAVWDKGGTPDRYAGHAMWINGKNPDGTYKCQTWA